MDYSSVAGDEHAGASPWATSPQQSRFPPQDSSQEIPPSPLPPGAQYGSENADSRPTTADSEAVERFPGKAPAENGEGHAARQQDAVGGGGGEGAAAPATQRRGVKAQGREKRPAPQYKLTAKVTGLERNGRKDPILRFDVYVYHPLLFPLYISTALTEYIRPTSPNSARRNSATSAAPTPNSSNCKNTSSPRTQNASSPPCLPP